MSDASWLTLFLGILSLCAVVLTVVGCLVAWHFHLTLRRLNELLPRSGRVIRQVQALLLRANAAARHLETAAGAIAQTVGETLEPLTGFSAGLRRFLQHFHGNGHSARAEPRQHVRRHH